MVGAPGLGKPGGVLGKAGISADKPGIMTRAERIRATIEATFDQAVVDVVDESHRHVGHAGARPEGETHYHLRVICPAFAGMSRVARSRAVHEALAAEFRGGLHALSLTLQTPDDAAR